jgi:hypothetical protein
MIWLNVDQAYHDVPDKKYGRSIRATHSSIFLAYRKNPADHEIPRHIVKRPVGNRDLVAKLTRIADRLEDESGSLAPAFVFEVIFFYKRADMPRNFMICLNVTGGCYLARS